MKLRKIVSIASAIFIASGALWFTSSASAAVINGTYSLTAATGGSSPLSGQVIADGTYQVDTGNIILPQYTDPNGNMYPFAATLSVFTFNDLTVAQELGSYSLGDFTFPQPVAILSGLNGNVLALYGDTGDISSTVLQQLRLELDNDGTVGEFSITASPFAGALFGSVSGTQAIPEPSPIALLGAGLLAFGTFRKFAKNT